MAQTESTYDTPYDTHRQLADLNRGDIIRGGRRVIDVYPWGDGRVSVIYDDGSNSGIERADTWVAATVVR